MEVAVLMGLQASGKSTFARTVLTATHVLVSKDLFPNARSKARRQQREIRAALAEGCNVVVDNTNPTAADRCEIIAVAREAGARVAGYFFESEFEACTARNAQRVGRGRVPDIALRATRSRLTRPSMSEGFDSLFYVRLRHGGGFDVEPWEEVA